MTRLAPALLAMSALAGCTTAPVATAQPPMPMPPAIPAMSAIQPETTITLMGRGSIEQLPDVAVINVGLQVEARTAAEAMAQQATNMNGVFAAVKTAGIADRDMQTGSMSLHPVYEYPNNARPRLTGYQASNAITIKVRRLDTPGQTLDAVVKGGGNTINGISFSIDEADRLHHAARVEAIKDAAEKAALYANALGCTVKRIVTTSEQAFYLQPPMPVIMRIQDMAAEATPIASGEVCRLQTVNVVFELTK